MIIYSIEPKLSVSCFHNCHDFGHLMHSYSGSAGSAGSPRRQPASNGRIYKSLPGSVSVTTDYLETTWVESNKPKINRRVKSSMTYLRFIQIFDPDRSGFTCTTALQDLKKLKNWSQSLMTYGVYRWHVSHCYFHQLAWYTWPTHPTVPYCVGREPST
jgi:hypothetical protein